jgi:anti-sigma factor RsiW
LNLNDELLLAYADDLLSPERREFVRNMMRLDAAIRDRVAALQASHLPYRAAFARQKLPPPPERLRQSIADLSSVAAAPAETVVAGAHTAATHDRRRRFFALTGAAALFAALCTMWRVLAS